MRVSNDSRMECNLEVASTAARRAGRVWWHTHPQSTAHLTNARRSRVEACHNVGADMHIQIRPFVGRKTQASAAASSESFILRRR